MQERWLPIVGYEGLYEISDFGRVKSLRRREAIRTRILKLVRHKRTGYLYVTLVRDEIKTGKRVNVLVAQHFLGPCPPGMQCRHLDGNRANNHIENLNWGTPKQNQHDRRAHGTWLSGEKNPCSVLTWGDVERIRESSLFGATLTQLALCYPLSKTTLSRVRRGLAWQA